MLIRSRWIILLQEPSVVSPVRAGKGVEAAEHLVWIV
jgi:hypothetical protein